MDIQVSSNFERLLFEAMDRDAVGPAAPDGWARAIGQLCTVPDTALAAIRAGFRAGRTDESETAATMRAVHEKSGYLLDPHTAVGVSVARPLLGGDVPVVTLATAHPAKFPAAVKAATGIEPALPVWLADLYGRKERFDVLPNDRGAVEAFIRARIRA
jgi:threonine synthase